MTWQSSWAQWNPKATYMSVFQMNGFCYSANSATNFCSGWGVWEHWAPSTFSTQSIAKEEWEDIRKGIWMAPSIWGLGKKARYKELKWRTMEVSEVPDWQKICGCFCFFFFFFASNLIIEAGNCQYSLTSSYIFLCQNKLIYQQEGTI